MYTLAFDSMQIPGISHLVEGSNLPNSVLLLTGPVGVGKTMYCRQFFIDGLRKRDHCIYISSNLSENQYRSLVADTQIELLPEYSRFVNPYLIEGRDNERLLLTLEEIDRIMANFSRINVAATNGAHSSEMPNTGVAGQGIRLIIDSLTHLFAVFGNGPVLSFVTELYFRLKKVEANAILTLSMPSPNEYVTLSSILDGILEMKLEGDSVLIRSMRILSIKGLHHNPSWVNFTIRNDGGLVFADRSTTHCYLCQKPILDTPTMHAGFPFHDYHVETYKKLSGVYGLNISEIGISSEVVDANFFYIDIVGLSNPLLSVIKQREKIENLFGIIKSCEAFRSEDMKIHLPTGDGMVIGFLLDPQLPLELAIELHRKLRSYNESKESPDERIGVRIGLSSGPVFAVNDIKNTQNFWGPGIILARRVMDIGDTWHILIAGVLAEKLIPLRPEFKKIIKCVGAYQIKHGQDLRLYSVYSNDFGNPDTPLKRA
jgi:KaiC/GvpD/RAD55 family RecA-like ATPase